MDTLVVRAFQLAAQLHATQTRKASLVPNTPYLSHLMEVAGIVMSNGGSSVVVAAALLHDAVEDQGAQTRALIQDRLGADVLALVEECTEPGTGGDEKAPWRERKEGYLQHIRQASPQALLISCADKNQNARDLRKQVYVYGDKAYATFTKGKAEKNWFAQAFVQAARQRLAELRSIQPDEPLLDGIDYLLFDQADILAYLEAH